MFCSRTRPRYQAVVELEGRQRGEHPALNLKIGLLAFPKQHLDIFKTSKYLKFQYIFIFLVEIHSVY